MCLCVLGDVGHVPVQAISPSRDDGPYLPMAGKVFRHLVVPLQITMVVKFKLSALRQTKWDEIFLRVLFGGLATVMTGMIAKSFGPVVGGLLLAFPAVFPASATLVEKHEKEKKQCAGLNGI